MEGTLDFATLGLRYQYWDGVSRFEILDKDVEVETEAGIFSTIKVKDSSVGNIEFTYYLIGEEQTYEGSIVIETVSYYVKDVGLVKQEIITTFDVDGLPGLDGISREEVKELSAFL